MNRGKMYLFGGLRSEGQQTEVDESTVTNIGILDFVGGDIEDIFQHLLRGGVLGSLQEQLDYGGKDLLLDDRRVVVESGDVRL